MVDEVSKYEVIYDTVGEYVFECEAIDSYNHKGTKTTTTIVTRGESVATFLSLLGVTIKAQEGLHLP